MHIVSDFTRNVQEEEDWIMLADGCRLAIRIWRPVDAESDPVPAILEYLPYRKRPDGDSRRADARLLGWPRLRRGAR